MAKKSTVTDNDLGFFKIQREVTIFNDHDIFVGINEGREAQSSGDSSQSFKAFDESSTSGGMTVAGYGAVHEFGSDDGVVPQRPWLRAAVDANLREVGTRMQSILEKIYDRRGKSDVTRDLNRLGLWGVKIVKDYIKKVGPSTWVPLAEATIKRKRSTRPLIDNGTMIRSITYVIKRKGAVVSESSAG